jgi:hypothetical protein
MISQLARFGYKKPASGDGFAAVTTPAAARPRRSTPAGDGARISDLCRWISGYRNA